MYTYWGSGCVGEASATQYVYEQVTCNGYPCQYLKVREYEDCSDDYTEVAVHINTCLIGIAEDESYKYDCSGAELNKVVYNASECDGSSEPVDSDCVELMFCGAADHVISLCALTLVAFGVAAVL